MAVAKLLVLLCAGVFAATAAPTAHVVLVIGQSNSVGTNGQGHTAEDVAYENIVQTSCCNNGQTTNDQCQLIQGQDPLRHQCDDGFVNGPSVGFGMSFARQLRASIPAEDVIILVPAAIGGTGFIDDVWTAYTGRGFVQALTRLRNTFPLVAQKYPTHTASFAGILWHQGEADADSIDYIGHLTKNLIPMINAWRDTNLIPQSGPTVPFVVGNLVPDWVNDVNDQKRLNILMALQLLSQYVPYTGVAPSLGLQSNPNGDNIHFTAASQRIFGRRYYAAFRAAQLDSVMQ